MPHQLFLFSTRSYSLMISSYAHTNSMVNQRALVFMQCAISHHAMNNTIMPCLVRQWHHMPLDTSCSARCNIRVLPSWHWCWLVPSCHDAWAPMPCCFQANELSLGMPLFRNAFWVTNQGLLNYHMPTCHPCHAMFRIIVWWTRFTAPSVAQPLPSCHTCWNQRAVSFF